MAFLVTGAICDGVELVGLAGCQTDGDGFGLSFGLNSKRLFLLEAVTPITYLCSLMKLWLLLVMSVILTGCATFFDVSINSFNTSSSSRLKKFYVLPGEKGVTEEDLQFREAKQYLGKALVSKGYKAVEKIADAEIIVFLQYGIGEPKTQTDSYTVPILGQTGGGTSYVNATSYGSGGIRTVSGTVTQQPTFGVTGYSSGTVSRTTFGRWMRVEAVDYAEFAQTRTVKSVWETRIISVGRSGDIREVIPVMIGAGTKHLGENTGKFVRVVLSESDERIERLKK